MNSPVRPLSEAARTLLKAAILTTCLAGVGGSMTSCATLAYYRSPRPVRSDLARAYVAPTTSVSASASAARPASSAVATHEGAVQPHMLPMALQREIHFDALDRFRRTRLPLAAANFVLSLALIVGAVRTLGLRPGARAWLQQVCVASALFALVDGGLSRGERDFTARQFELAQDPPTPEALAPAYRLVSWVALLMEVTLFAGLAQALSSSSVVLELAPREAQSPRRDRRRGDDDGDDDGESGS